MARVWGLTSLFVMGWALSACQTSSLPRDYVALYPDESLTATEIISRAHTAAGGETWTHPESLSMSGYSIFYRGGKASKHEIHNMWRVYEAGKTDAHKVDGKVRLESIKDGKTIIDLSFDGTTTYTSSGPQPPSESDKRWSSNFGFGVIRHALDEGYMLSRDPDDLIDGREAFMVRVHDPAGGETQFGIGRDDYAILKVGFVAPRGWHERIYSDFYSNPEGDWLQPGRVRLYYNGVKANEVIWTSFAINEGLPDCLFVLPEVDECRPE